MYVLDHVRWHFILPFVGTLLIIWLSWQLALIVLGTIAMEYGLRNGYERTRRRLNAMPGRASPTLTVAENVPERPAFVTRRLSLSFMHVYGMQCCLCRGAGCGECANTGLR
jgi:hypothetical protein